MERVRASRVASTCRVLVSLIERLARSDSTAPMVRPSILARATVAALALSDDAVTLAEFTASPAVTAPDSAVAFWVLLVTLLCHRFGPR